MKPAIPLTLAVLALTALLSWRNESALYEARSDSKRLRAILDEMPAGHPTSPGGDATNGGHLRRSSADATTVPDGKELAQQIISRGIDSGSFEPPADVYSGESMLQWQRLCSSLHRLDATELKAFLEEINRDSSLREGVREQWRRSALGAVATGQPGELLKYAESMEDQPGKHARLSLYAGLALKALAQGSLAEAEAWLKTGAAERAGLGGEGYAESLMVRGIGEEDPALAFSLLNRVNADDRQDIVAGMAGAAHNAETRTRFLNDFRGYVETLPEEQRKQTVQEIVRSLTPAMALEGYEACMTWVEATHLTPQEKTAVAMGAGDSTVGGDAGKWLSWMQQQSLPEQELATLGQRMTSQWTHDDPAAAEAWLSTLPPGTLRDVAVPAFIGQMQGEHPEQAAKWIATLPPGDKRDELRKEVLSAWKTRDPEAAKAFEESGH